MMIYFHKLEYEGLHCKPFNARIYVYHQEKNIVKKQNMKACKKNQYLNKIRLFHLILTLYIHILLYNIIYRLKKLWNLHMINVNKMLDMKVQFNYLKTEVACLTPNAKFKMIVMLYLK